MSESDETPGGSLFSQLANAMIERSLPAIREWLRARLGPRATLGEVSVEGTRVTVRRARIPLGAAVILDVERATLIARPEGFASGRAPAHLERLDGIVRFERGALTTLSAPVEIEGRAGDGRAWVDGTLRLAGATWRPTLGVGDALPLSGTAELRVAAEAWSVRDAALESGGCTVRGWASGALGGEVLRSGELTVEAARLGHTLDVLEAFRGQRVTLPVPLPLDARVDLDAALGGERARGSVTVSTDRTRATLRFEHAAGAIRDGHLEGTLDPAELVPEAARRFVVLDGCEVVRVAGQAEGPLDALEGTVQLTADAWALRGMRAPAPARALLALRGASGVDFDLTLEGAGRAFGRAALRGPSGQRSGHASLTLEPDAWALGDRRLGGEPVRAELTLAGGRLEVSGQGPRVELSRGDAPPLVLRRAHGHAAFADGALVSGEASARVGPGRARIRRRPEGGARVQIDRADREDLVALHDLLFSRGWLGRARADARFVVPEGTQAWADLTWAGGRLEGTVHAEAPRSRLSFTPLSLDLSTGQTTGTVARAIVSHDDARAIGLVPDAGFGPVGGRVELGATLTGAGRDTRLFVAARAEELALGAHPGATPAAVARDLLARVVIDARGVEVRELRAEVLGGRLEARGGYLDRALRLDRASFVASGPELRARLAGDDPDALPGLALRIDARGTAEALEGVVVAETERSRLRMSIGTTTADGGLLFDPDATRLAGHVHPADLAPWLGPVALRAEAPLGVLGRVGGSWARPDATLEVVGGPGELVVEGADRARALGYDELTGEVALGRDRSSGSLTLHGLGGGRARLEAAVLTGRPLLGTLGRLTLDDVDLGDTLGEVDGSLTARASGFKLRGAGAGLTARATLSDARYPVLTRLAPLLTRYGLTPPPPHGKGDATLRARLDRDGWRIHELEAAVEGVRVTGDVTRSPAGAWGGGLRVEAAAAWLRASRLLRGPASWLGDLVIPIRVEGEGAPRLRADVLAALDRAIATTRFGRGVQRAIDRVLEELFRRPPPPAPAAPHHEASDVTPTDALIDRVAEGAEDADRALSALLERELSPRELADRLLRRARA